VPHPTQLLIGGTLLDGDGATTSVENPFTTESIVEVPFASPVQVDAAVAAAREAWPGWARTSAGERCEMLHEVARRLREDAVELARTMTAEGGGFKQSGLGRELGREGLEAFQETKHVHMETRIERKEWWYPYREYGAE
jgi:acyl-CoA reductase-like NAD-dependent aldehyde dehydrogenase